MKHWNKEVAKEVCPQITIKITKEDIVNLISSAIDGICYWGNIVPNARPYEEAQKRLCAHAEPDYDDGEVGCEEVIAQILFDGKSVTVRDIEDDEESWLSLSNLSYGIQKAVQGGYYSDYNWLVPDGDGSCKWHLETSRIDAEVADAIIQLSVLGEIVYG